MNKKTFKIYALLLCLASVFGAKAQNYAWPANWEGVMLQGFYWDSYNDSRWTVLTSQADELSQYFKLIWVPNSGNAGNGQQMGYMPQYWFTNHNSSFGTEAELRQMIQTYKAKGTGIIADVVINHRNGVNDWADFPTEEWNGRTWHIGLDGICRNDNLAGLGHGNPTGAYDTGEQFDGCRDLDHTNANVQDNCKNYCKFLLDDLGYAGFRLDMVKGYAGRYTKMYNEYAKPTYCVGECFDGSYDVVKAWIDATGKQSAAFDFPFKYAVKEAFASGDMTKLVWNAGFTTPQPAGMIHYEYQQYAVTFIDNHDTYREDWNKFQGNVVAANAFMLCSPGTPCVFLPHYKQNKQAIQQLINIRNSVGLSNTSKVNVLKTSNDCYMAEVTGSKGKLVVKIGSAMVSPEGYSNDDIKASGSDYCIWTKAKIEGGTSQGGGNVGTTAPDRLYLMGHIPAGAWQTNAGVTMTKNGNKFKASNVTILDAGEGKNLGFFSFVTALGTTGSSDEWDGVINGSDRYGAASKDAPVAVGGSAPMQAFYAGVDASAANSWAIAPGTYDIVADFDAMTITVSAPGQGGGDDPVPVPMPARLYLMGHIPAGAWQTNAGISMEKDNNVFVARNVEILDSGDGNGYFSFVTALGTTGSSDEWDGVINGSDRYGATSKDAPVTVRESAPMQAFLAGVDASAANSWAIAPGTYDIVANFRNMTMTASPTGQGGGDTYPDLYVVGYAYGITPPTDYKMECRDGVYSIVMDDLSNGFAIAGNGLNPFFTTAGTVALNTNYVLDSSDMQLMILEGDNKNVKLEFNLATKTLCLSKASGIDQIETETDAPAEYYTLQGIKVSNPSNGYYIVVRSGRASKIFIR